MAKKEPVRSVLIPILSRSENNSNFLASAIQGFDQVVLLVVIDRNELVGRFGFVATEIRAATALIETIKTFLENQGKKVQDVTEWGETSQKIAHLAELYNCEKIVLVKQENEYFKKLVAELQTNTTKQIETIPIVVPAVPTGSKKP